MILNFFSFVQRAELYSAKWLHVYVYVFIYIIYMIYIYKYIGIYIGIYNCYIDI